MNTLKTKGWIFLVIIQVIWTQGVSAWKSGPPDGLPELVKLNVDCGKEEMTIQLEFSAPYEGSVYSKTSGQGERCIHVSPHSHVTGATFTIEYNRCGTRSDPKGKYYENTIIIQYDDVVIEAWDEAKKIRCEWHDGYEKSAYKMPITISDLDVVEMNFQGDDVDCWLEVQDGKGPWSAKVDGLIPLGSPLTLVVAIQDSEGHFDMRVKSCIAHDGHKYPIYLTDEDGCVLRPKMMSPFQKTTDTKGTASVIAYSHFYAFKFPETVEVTIQCTVEICRHGCSSTCTQGRNAAPGKDGTAIFGPPSNGKETDDIPTYKDSNPFSTIVTSRPGRYNYSSSVNASSSVIVSSSTTNISSSYNSDPLEGSSSDAQHNYYMNKYPYDLLDVLMAEDRLDERVDEYSYHDGAHDNAFSENKDDVYYAQAPNIFQEEYGHGKNFPVVQDSQNISKDGINETEYDSFAPIYLHPLKNETESSSESLPKPLKFIEHIEDHTEPMDGHLDSLILIHDDPNQSILINDDHNTTISMEKEHDVITSDIDPIPLTSTEIAPTPSPTVADFKSEHVSNSTDFLISREDKGMNMNDALREIIENVTVHSIFTHPPDDQPLSTESAENVVEAVPERTQNQEATEPDIHFESRTESSRDTPSEQSSRKIGDDRERNKYQESEYDDYYSKSRKPLDSIETQLNFHQKSYRPYKPPAPVPPLTLYNGVPLHFYNHQKTNRKLSDWESQQYVQGRPYHYEYLKSKLRSPGRIRKRREIGEREQLGLKQTLRVIAPSDLDFASKSGDKKTPLYVGHSDVSDNLCLAPSSFAAGLGLLLLANVCVLCVVAFLGHHYYVHRKAKVQTVELLCMDMSS